MRRDKSIKKLQNYFKKENRKHGKKDIKNIEKKRKK